MFSIAWDEQRHLYILCYVSITSIISLLIFDTRLSLHPLSLFIVFAYMLVAYMLLQLAAFVSAHQ
jgi:phosphoglycerol transferase MdoB-like AlkP superfamily enzyme